MRIRTRARRIAGALAVTGTAVVLGVSGCAQPIAGTAFPVVSASAPVVERTGPPERAPVVDQGADPSPEPEALSPEPEALSPEPEALSSEPEAAIYREWVGRGWTPVPWLPVTDPDSGVTAYLLGPASREDRLTDPQQVSLALYRSTAGPLSVNSGLSVARRPTGADLGPGGLHYLLQQFAQGFRGSAGPAEQLTVQGRPALAARVDSDTGPLSGRVLIVDAPQHVVILFTVGPAAEDRTVGQAHDLTVRLLELP